MKCINCYQEIDDGLKFCPKCGFMQPNDRAAYEMEHPDLAKAIPENELLELATKPRQADMPPAQVAPPVHIVPPVQANPPVLIVPPAFETKSTDDYNNNTLKKQRPKKKKTAVIIAFIAGLAVALIAALAFVLLTNHKSRHHKSSSRTEEVNDSFEGDESTSAEVAEATETMEQTAFLGGRTPWEEFYIDSQQYGYANVREYTSKDAPKVKRINTNEHFYGWRLEEDPDWIEVYDDNGNTIGYMWYKCARHTGNTSEGER